MASPRAVSPKTIQDITAAIHALKQARARLSRAGARRATEHVRRCLKSADGAPVSGSSTAHSGPHACRRPQGSAAFPPSQGPIPCQR
jgi:hypothetical protein